MNFFPLQGHLKVYRFCDNVWTFVLNKVEFKDLPETVQVDKVKVVACDGRGTLLFVNQDLNLSQFSMLYSQNTSSVHVFTNIHFIF